MSDAYLTTPFGRRTMTLGQLARQAATHAADPDAAVQKWQVFRAVTESKAKLGVSDRSLAVLNALLSFHPDAQLGPGTVVFPSNRELSLRAHGMAPATLRRHLSALVEAGLVIRRDSPNGKRYARKGPGGRIEIAFGFDLSPLVIRAREFDHFAEEVRAARKAVILLRERISLLRRDARKLIILAQHEALDGPWPELTERLNALSLPLTPRMGQTDLEPVVENLERLCAELHNALKNHINCHALSANESQIERHQHSSSTDHQDSERRASPSTPSQHPTPRQPNITPPMSLGDVLSACPSIGDYSRGPITSWSDLAGTADVVRAVMGIDPQGWQESCAVLGPREAATVIAAMLQRHDHIRSPRAYLGALTQRARAGEFSTRPMLLALLRSRMATLSRTDPPRSLPGNELRRATRRPVSVTATRS